MIGDKRGLSTIVVTLIIILLSLVAVGIVWVVVKGMISGGGSQLQISSKCMNVDVTATNVLCVAATTPTNWLCNVTLARTAGTASDAVDGVKLVFKNTSTQTTSTLITSPTDVPPMLGRRALNIDTGISSVSGLLHPDSVDVAVFFRDSTGNENLCASQLKVFYP